MDGAGEGEGKRETVKVVEGVEDLDIRCERLAVRYTCFGVAVQDFIYIQSCMY